MKLTVKEIAEACGGRILCGDENAVVTSFITDSRTAAPGTMFVPIVGERVEAHHLPIFAYYGITELRVVKRSNP